MDYRTGLVLSGGGTKGIAHAGVLKFLEEQQIKVDVISGTSAGALVGALYAYGKSPEDILAFFQSVHFSTGSIWYLTNQVLSAQIFSEFIWNPYSEIQK
jgi:predicted acylesterase/phospholipase RssA